VRRSRSARVFAAFSSGRNGSVSRSARGYTLCMNVTYVLEPNLSPADFIDVLVRSTLAERRPVGRADVIRAMLKHADIIVTARVDNRLVGVSRAITDFAYCTYLSDLAVDEAFQKRGIGRELIGRTHTAAGLHTKLVLLAAPKAHSYYQHIGMDKHDSCWLTKPKVSD
jgi:GNAT superfamily N-acetyltransferase